MPDEMIDKDRDLKIYAFENAMNILSNSVEVFTSDHINELFELSDRIYKYLKGEDNDARS